MDKRIGGMEGLSKTEANIFMKTITPLQSPTLQYVK